MLVLQLLSPPSPLTAAALICQVIATSAYIHTKPRKYGVLHQHVSPARPRRPIQGLRPCCSYSWVTSQAICAASTQKCLRCFSTVMHGKRHMTCSFHITTGLRSHVPGTILTASSSCQRVWSGGRGPPRPCTQRTPPTTCNCMQPQGCCTPVRPHSAQVLQADTATSHRHAIMVLSQTKQTTHAHSVSTSHQQHMPLHHHHYELPGSILKLLTQLCWPPPEQGWQQLQAQSHWPQQLSGWQ